MLVSSSTFSGVTKLDVEIEKLLFSSVILKRDLVASKVVTANNHFTSSNKFIGDEKEKLSFVLLVKFKCYLRTASSLFN